MGWLLNGAFQAVALFVMVLAAMSPVLADRSSGKTYSHWQTGATLMTAVVVTVHLQIASVITYWTWLHHLAIWGSIGEQGAGIA